MRLARRSRPWTGSSFFGVRSSGQTLSWAYASWPDMASKGLSVFARPLSGQHLGNHLKATVQLILAHDKGGRQPQHPVARRTQMYSAL